MCVCVTLCQCVCVCVCVCSICCAWECRIVLSSPSMQLKQTGSAGGQITSNQPIFRTKSIIRPNPDSKSPSVQNQCYESSSRKTEPKLHNPKLIKHLSYQISSWTNRGMAGAQWHPPFVLANEVAGVARDRKACLLSSMGTASRCRMLLGVRLSGTKVLKKARNSSLWALTFFLKQVRLLRHTVHEEVLELSIPKSVAPAHVKVRRYVQSLRWVVVLRDHAIK